jgi:tetratricopeptide (TPR) repeat protein
MMLIMQFGLAAPYGVEVLRTPNHDEALEKQASQMKKGFAPVGIYKEGVIYRVIIGKYDDVMSSKWIAWKLKESGVEGKIVSFENATPIPESIEAAGQTNNLPESVKFLIIKNAPLPETSFQSDRTEVKEFENVRKNKSIDELEASMQNILDQASMDDPIRGWALLRNGYLQLLKKDSAAAVESFRLLAEGSVASTKSQRCEALLRLGFSLEGQKRKIESYQAFEALKNLTERPLDGAIAQVQQAGIIMEVARGSESDRGTLEDCRNACQKVFEYVTSEKAPQTCATAELMFFETYYYANDYTKTIELGLQFLEKYSKQTRETSMAILFIGMALDNTGNYDQAVQTLLKVFEKDFSKKGTAFGADGKPWDMKQKAADWIKYLARKHKDPELITRLADQYPEYFASHK